MALLQHTTSGSSATLTRAGSAAPVPDRTGRRVHRAVGKIPPELRIPRIRFEAEPNPIRRLLLRFRHDAHFTRSCLQAGFALLCVWIGVEFHGFVQWVMSGGAAAYVERPPGVEGFLPISALISLRYWIETGVINDIHPSGLLIPLAILAASMPVKESFCSWLCPVGTLSEALWNLGRKIFGRTFNDIAAVLVMEHGMLLGIFSERDYARKVILYGKSSKETTVGDLMSSPVITIDPKNPINDCLVLMTTNHIRHVPVVEYGRVIGMVTIGDIVSAVIAAQEMTIRDLENYITGKDFEYRPMYLGG